MGEVGTLVGVVGFVSTLAVCTSVVMCCSDLTLGPVEVGDVTFVDKPIGEVAIVGDFALTTVGEVGDFTGAETGLVAGFDAEGTSCLICPPGLATAAALDSGSALVGLVGLI